MSEEIKIAFIQIGSDTLAALERRRQQCEAEYESPATYDDAICALVVDYYNPDVFGGR
jgi:hypothetical protein